MILIEPIQFPTVGTADRMQIKVMEFATTDKTAQLFYQIFADNGKVCTHGTYDLTEAEYTAWADDNNYLDELMCAKLNLTKVGVVTDERENEATTDL